MASTSAKEAQFESMLRDGAAIRSGGNGKKMVEGGGGRVGNSLAGTPPTSLTAEELTPIVLNQLQSTNRIKEGNRKLRRGSNRSSQSSTPAGGDPKSGRSSGGTAASNGLGSAETAVAPPPSTIGAVPNQPPPSNNKVFESESESSCGEESRRRTAEAFMSGIQSAIQEKTAEGGGGNCQQEAASVANAAAGSSGGGGGAGGSTSGGLSAELVGEVESVLAKLMSSLQKGDPSLIPLITNLQMSLKATVNQEPGGIGGGGGGREGHCSELFGNESAYSNIEDEVVVTSSAAANTSKIPWKIRAARKRALKHHTTGMTKDEFAQIKQSLSQSSITFSAKPAHSYALARNKSEGTILHLKSNFEDEDDNDVAMVQRHNNPLPSTYQQVEGNRAYSGGAAAAADGNQPGGGGGTTSWTTPSAGGSGQAKAAADMGGYASDVCDYNMTSQQQQQQSHSSSVSSNKQHRAAMQIQTDTSYVHSGVGVARPVSLVSRGFAALKPMSPSIESSLCSRRQKLIQKRAQVFKSMENLASIDKQEVVTSQANRGCSHRRDEEGETNNITDDANGDDDDDDDDDDNSLSFSNPLYVPPLCRTQLQADESGDPIVVKINDEEKVVTDLVDDATAQAGNSSDMPQRRLSHQSSLEDDNSQRSSRSLNAASMRDQRRSKSGSTSGVRAKIARRKLMRQANALDVPPQQQPHGSLSDQEQASENNDDDDFSIEEKHDSEPMDDADSSKHKDKKSSLDVRQAINASGSDSQMASSSVMTPETARKNWNSRFSNIKNSFSAASEEELSIMKSRSPSINRTLPLPPPQQQPLPSAAAVISQQPYQVGEIVAAAAVEGEEGESMRGRSKVKTNLSGSPNTTRREIQAPNAERTKTPGAGGGERPPSKEDKNKFNNANRAAAAAAAAGSHSRGGYLSDSGPAATAAAAVASEAAARAVEKKNSLPAMTSQPKSKQPTPNRDPAAAMAASGRVSKSLPREAFNEQSRAEVLGLVRAERDPGGGGSAYGGGKNNDMDYQEYMNIINRVRRTKECSRLRAEHYRLDSMYAKEKKRQEELKMEEERLQRERQKIEAEQRKQLEMQRQQELEAREAAAAATAAAASGANNDNNNNRAASIQQQQQQQQMQPSNQTMAVEAVVAQDSNRTIAASNSSENVEKGQLDKTESEWEKPSPSPQKPASPQQQQQQQQPDLPYPIQNAAVTEPSITKPSMAPVLAQTATPPAAKRQTSTPLRRPPSDDQKSTTTRSSSSGLDDKYHQEQLRLHNIQQEQAKQEQLRLEQIQQEQKRQQELREKQVRAEQEKLEKLRQEQERQEKEREEIRRLEFERLQQIQEEQMRLEQERFKQQQRIRMEQMRLEEERKKHEKLQAERNALYNRQRLDMEAQNIAMSEAERAIKERHQKQQQAMSPVQRALSAAGTPASEVDSRGGDSMVDASALSPQEKIIQERLLQQDKLRQEHRKEEAQIRQEKLNLIQQEEALITKQEEMLHQIEAEREKLRKQEDIIRAQQQERLQNVRQEKLLLEKQEEMLFMRKEQLMQERLRQEKLRDEQKILREQEEAIRKRQEEICKELMGEGVAEDMPDHQDIKICEAIPGQVFMGKKPVVLEQQQSQEPPSNNPAAVATTVQSVLSPDEYGFGNTTHTNTDSHNIDQHQQQLSIAATAMNNNSVQTSNSSIALQQQQQGQLPVVTFNSVNDYCEPPTPIAGEEGEEEGVEEGDEEDEEGSWTGSGSDDDTLDEDGYYESKVEVKQNQTSVPTSVRTIETKIDNPPWAPITPYLTYSEKQNIQNQEEISAIFSQPKTTKFSVNPGVVTSPESLRTSTNLITTPESSLSLQSQRSSQTDPQSQSSSRTSSPPVAAPPPLPPPPIPPLPVDRLAVAVSPPTANAAAASDQDCVAGLSSPPQQPNATTQDPNFLTVDTAGGGGGGGGSGGSNGHSPGGHSPRIGGPGSAFKPYASSENLYDPNNFRKVSSDGREMVVLSQNYPLQNGDSTKLTDSRYFMQLRPPPHQGAPSGAAAAFSGGPVFTHSKIRELRKPIRAPFSTTDTEPEMRECNLTTANDSRKKGGKSKMATYSTSETEEEYQAYLRSKPRWHGKSGHGKDSWDPLLIQSPPQITQKPVGIIQKPKAQPPPPGAAVIERGMQVDHHQYHHLPMQDYQAPISSTGMEELMHQRMMEEEQQLLEMKWQQQQEELIRQEEERKKAEQMKQQEVQKQRQLELQRQQELLKQRQIEQQQKELQRQQEIQKQQEMERQQRQKQAELQRQQELKKQEELKRQREQERLKEIEIQKLKQIEIQKQQEVQRQQEMTRQKELERQNEIERQKQAELAKRQEEAERQRQIELQRQQQQKKEEAEAKRQKELEEKKQLEEQQRIREELARQAAQKAGFERIKKSDSIIEVRRNNAQQKQNPVVQKSKSVKDLAGAFLDQSRNLVPHSVAEINRKSLTMSSDCLAVGGAASTEEGLRGSASPNVPHRLFPNAADLSTNASTTTSESEKSKEPSPNVSTSRILAATGGQVPQRKQSNPRKEMHQKLMNEALLKVEYKKEKAKPFNQAPVTRTNPTIAAMEIMTRKEIKMGEMEQRLARGELPTIPIPETPVHMKSAAAAATKPRILSPKPQLGGLQRQFSGGGSESEQSQQPPVIILKKQPKRLDEKEIKARKASAEGRKTPSGGAGIGAAESSSAAAAAVIQQPKSPDAAAVKLSQQHQQQPKTVTQKQYNNQHQKNSISNQQPTPSSAQSTSNNSKPQSQPPPPQHQITSKVAQAFSAVKAKVATTMQPADNKAKGDTLTRKNSKTAKANSGKASAAATDQQQSVRASKGQDSQSHQKQAQQQPPQRQVKAESSVSKAQLQQKEQEKHKNLPTEITQEVKHETVKKAAERFEKATAAQSAAAIAPAGGGGGGGGSTSSSSAAAGSTSYFRERSRSIGHSLSQKLAAVTDGELEEDDMSKKILPWASAAAAASSDGGGSSQKSSNSAVVRKRNFMRQQNTKNQQQQGYQLRMSKSSDSITAAKLLAEARMKENSGQQKGSNGQQLAVMGRSRPLRINQCDMSNSIEKQIDVYTKTREDIRRILKLAKSCSVADRVKLLDNQSLLSDQEKEEGENLSKAEAIRKEIMDAKQQQQQQSAEATAKDVQMQSPVESKVKPLKIPIKPKISNAQQQQPQQQPQARPSPGTGLRINQSVNVGRQPQQQMDAAFTSGGNSSGQQMRIGRSNERGNNDLQRSKSLSSDQPPRRNSIENIASVKERIETYLTSAASGQAPAEQPPPSKQISDAKSPMSSASAATTAATASAAPETKSKPKSILTNKKKTPKLIHQAPAPMVANNRPQLAAGPKIYMQSATEEEGTDAEEYHRQQVVAEASKLKLLQVPKRRDHPPTMMQGVVKSKSFATPGQFECALDQQTADEKKRTMLAFFTSQQQHHHNHQNKSSQGSSSSHHQQQQEGVMTRSLTTSRAAAAAASSSYGAFAYSNNGSYIFEDDSGNKRESIVSISDEIIGEEDLHNVDAVFESLLHSTFSESENSSCSNATASLSHSRAAAGATAAGATVGKRPTTKNSECSTATKSGGGASNTSSSSSKRNSSVTRKPSKSELVAGEVKASNLQSSADQKADQLKLLKQLQQQHHQSSEQQQQQPQEDMYKNMNDPLAALPTSHTKKYLPRQQTWAGPSTSSTIPTPSSPPPVVNSPSPTQSEYDTCDPWDDY